jgi:hypothetical protein
MIPPIPSELTAASRRAHWHPMSVALLLRIILRRVIATEHHLLAQLPQMLPRRNAVKSNPGTVRARERRHQGDIYDGCARIFFLPLLGKSPAMFPIAAASRSHRSI